MPMITKQSCKTSFVLMSSTHFRIKGARSCPHMYRG